MGPWGTIWKEKDVPQARQVAKQVYLIIWDTIQKAKAAGIPKKLLEDFNSTTRVYLQNALLNQLETLRTQMAQKLQPLFNATASGGWSDTVVRENLQELVRRIIEEVY